MMAAPASAQAWAISPTAVPLRRMASSGSRAQPSTSVQAAAWITTSGRWSVTSRRAETGSSRLCTGRSQARTSLTAEASVSCLTSEVPSRPPAPVTATRIRAMLSPGLAGAGQPSPVLPLVVVLPLPSLDAPPPILVLEIPVHGGRQARLEGHLVRPAKGGELGAVHGIAAVVARPILDLPDERPRLAQVPQECRHDLAIGSLVIPGDVVRLTGGAVLQDVADGSGMVRDVKPLTALEAVAVERQLLVVDGVRDEERDQLLGVVVRAVCVRPASNHDIEAVGHEVGPGEQLPAGLGRRVRGARFEAVVLAALAGFDRAVDLVGGDLQEARSGRALSLDGALLLGSAGFEKNVNAQYIRAEEGLGVQDGPVHVRLGSEVDDGVDLGHQRRPALRVGDVALDETESGGLLRIGQGDIAD